MAHETGPALGMSVGATTLAAVTADRAVTRSPVLTFYPDRPSQVGSPTENGESHETISAGSGLVITDFVDRVGGPDPVVAADGSARPAAQLLADGLHALACLATGGDPLPVAVAVAYPAHWPVTAVQALQDALGRVPQWSEHPASLISDVAATLTALQANPGLPRSGIIAVCDFGGSGSTITLVDAGRDYRMVGATVRHTGFSGQVIDQLLLDHVVAELGANGPGDPAPAIGSPTRLRGQCSNVKEQLSVDTVAELPGFHGGVWITRAELDEAIRQPLDGFFAVLRESLADNQIQAADLVAVVSVGGLASVPAINHGLAEHFGVPVISSPRSHLTAAIGAALGVADVSELAAAPDPGRAVPAPASESEPITAAPELRTPEFEPVMPLPETDASRPVLPLLPPRSTRTLPDLTAAPAASTGAVPQRTLESEFGEADQASSTWLRRPVPVILGAALAALVMGTVAVIALRHAADSQPESPLMTTEPSTTTAGPSTLMTPSLRPIPGQGPMFPEIPTMLPGPEAIAPAPETPETAVAP